MGLWEDGTMRPWDYGVLGLWGDGAFLSVSDMKRWGGASKSRQDFDIGPKTVIHITCFYWLVGI